MSDQPGPTHRPYGESDPYGQQPYQPYGQNPYGQQPGFGLAAGDRRPGTVTAAAWITIIFAALTAALFGITGLALIVARGEVIAEMERVPEFEQADIDPDAVVGVLAAVMIGLVIWCLIAIVLAAFVLRRSNVARILLVISAAVSALLSLLTITSVVTVVPLIASVAAIVLLFSGGAGDWFKHLPAAGHPGGYTGYTGYQGGYASPYAGGSYPDPYGQQPQQPAPESPPQYPNPYGNPYGGVGEQGSQPGQADSPNPYGQYPQGDDSPDGRDGGDHPAR